MIELIFLSPHSDPQARLGEPDSGGQCVYENQLALHLSKYGNVKVKVFCRQKYSYPLNSKINDNYEIIRIPCGPGSRFVPKEELEPLLDEFTDGVIEHLNTENQIILYGHYWDGGAAALIIKDKLAQKNLPLIWTPHSLGIAKRKNFMGIENEKKFNFIPRITWENYTMMMSDQIIVSTENEKQQLIHDYSIDEDKICIINPGVNHDNDKIIDKIEARKFLNLPLNKNIIMSLGRLDRRKGYHNCIKAFAALDKKHMKNSVLAIFSGSRDKLSTEEKEYLEELKNLASKLQIRDKVIFRRAVDYDDVHNIFFASDVYLCLSSNEPFGLTVIESMNFNTPVIATKEGGPASIISDGINGFLVDSQDSTKIAKIIGKVLVSDTVKENITVNAQIVIKKVYSWKVKIKEYEKIFKILLKQKKNYRYHFFNSYFYNKLLKPERNYIMYDKDRFESNFKTLKKNLSFYKNLFNKFNKSL